MSPHQVSQKVEILSIEESHSGQRVDNFLITRLKGVPKSRIYRIIRKGEVRINKKRIKPEYKLKTGDLLRIPPVRVSESKQLTKPSDKLQALLKSSIIYEDEVLLIINKPSGLPVHAGTGVKIGLIEALRAMFPSEQQLELAHRIDKGTSGCLLISKNNQMLKILNKAFKDGTVEKVYHALVTGNWPSHIEEVDAKLFKRQPRSGERYVVVSEEGKVARTKFRSLQCFKAFTLVEARPFTGRTHQIRVHAQFVGCPISGDEKYNTENSNKILKNQGVGRLCLHAAKLTITHPLSKQRLTVNAPHDKSFEKAINLLKNS